MTNIIEAVQKILGSSDAIGRLNDQASTKAGELERLTKELRELDRERSKLWVAHDVDGVDVTNSLAIVEKKRAALAEKIERIDVVFSEIEQRRHLAQDEINRQQFLAAVNEMQDINADVEQLDAEFRAATAAFLEAAARSARSNARKRQLSAIQQAYSDAHEGEAVIHPVWCEQINSVDFRQPDIYSPGFGHDVLLSLKVEWLGYGGRRIGASHDAYLLERAGAHFNT